MLLKVLCLLWQSQIMHYRLQTLSYLISICNPVRANEIKMNFNQLIFICFVHWSFSVSIPYWSQSWIGNDPIHSAVRRIILQLHTRFSSCICSILGLNDCKRVKWSSLTLWPLESTPGQREPSSVSVFRDRPSCPRSWTPEILSQDRGETPDSRSLKWITL